MHTVPPIQDIRFRTELRPGDLGYVAFLHGLLYAKECGYGFRFEGYVLEGLRELLEAYDPGRDRVWVGEDKEKIIGFLAGVHRKDSVQLRYFLLLPEYRGRGLGKILMDGFLQYMEEKGYTKAYLWTTHEQQAAIALYERYGFHLVEEKYSDAFDKPLVERKYELERNGDRFLR